MQTLQAIRCPNCGSLAERYYFSKRDFSQTQCPSCDYLMVSCVTTGRVVEAYAPGLSIRRSH
ncbi:replication restart DNA helicase PriA [Laspinema palackyanum]|jgi:hypothetical protein|uniref:replication restart DNA helicase PriA n=1 Tax=Laspinema palackyanum TaxID=3231601 RepID=UPI00345DF17F|nr:replication restart DNA helicase PriA [Laspinema sp. D2c]